MGKSSALHAEGGPVWLKKMRKVAVSGGPLKGALYGDLPESEVAKSAKGYRGDPRFMQYCRQYMASKLLEGTEQPGRQSESQAKLSRIVEWVAKNAPYVYKNSAHVYKTRFLIISLLFILVITRPSFSILCGKLTVLVVKTVFRKSIAFVTMILDTILEEALLQVDSALTSTMTPSLREPVPQVHGMEPMDHQPQSLQLVMQLACLAVGTLLGRNYALAPQPARNF